MLAYTKFDNPALYFSVAPICVRIGGALYSAGAEVSECLRWFEKAADYQHRFLVDEKKFKLANIGTIDNYLEIYSAAFLAGKSGELIAALEQCSYSETPPPLEMKLLTQFCDFLRGGKIDTDEKQLAELKALHERWGVLPLVLSTVSKKDAPGARAALDDYLANHWGPPIEKTAKKALKSPSAEFWGRWSFFSAAACKILEVVPDLGSRAKSYVPTELAG